MTSKRAIVDSVGRIHTYICMRIESFIRDDTSRHVDRKQSSPPLCFQKGFCRSARTYPRNVHDQRSVKPNGARSDGSVLPATCARVYRRSRFAGRIRDTWSAGSVGDRATRIKIRIVGFHELSRDRTRGPIRRRERRNGFGFPPAPYEVARLRHWVGYPGCTTVFLDTAIEGLSVPAPNSLQRILARFGRMTCCSSFASGGSQQPARGLYCREITTVVVVCKRSKYFVEDSTRVILSSKVRLRKIVKDPKQKCDTDDGGGGLKKIFDIRFGNDCLAVRSRTTFDTTGLRKRPTKRLCFQ